MKTFKIEVRESLARTIEIKANNEDEAFEMVKNRYHNEEIVLDFSDYVGVDFELLEEEDE